MRGRAKHERELLSMKKGAKHEGELSMEEGAKHEREG